MKDLQKLKQQTNIIEVVSNYVSLNKKGTEHWGLCPFHNDRSPSLSVNENKQVFRCHACGEKGDSLDFLMATGKTLPEAAEELESGIMGGSFKPVSNASKKKEEEEWKAVKCSNVPASFTHYKWGTHTDKWEYYYPDGHLFGYVLRFDVDGKKIFSQYWHATNGKRNAWIWKGFPIKRPLYNLHLLTQYPKARVLVVEGEKCAREAQKHLPSDKTVVTTWPFGGNSVHLVDFSPLKGRSIGIWGDNDCEGLSAALHIAHIAQAKKAVYLPLDPDKPRKWDCADKEWTEGEFAGFLRDNMKPLPELGKIYTAKQPQTGEEWEFGMKGGKWYSKDLSKEREKEKAKADNMVTSEKSNKNSNKKDLKGDDSKKSQKKASKSDDLGTVGPPQKPQKQSFPFKALGYGKNEQGTQSFFFYVYRSKQVVRLTASSMTKSNLITLASLPWWEMMFGSLSGDRLLSAQNSLIEQCFAAGLYDPENTRGRGAWIDGEDVVIHAGDELIVSGVRKSFQEHDSRFTYERGSALKFDLNKPASNKDASQLLDLCTLINWERPVNAYLLAGWCVLAPVCGSLSWRPHVWITGSAGTGKTWTMDNIVKPLLGNIHLALEGNSTEAGIRQWLGSDALPIVFDEAEGNDEKGQERMQNVNDLMRSASSSSGSKVAKGNSAGTGIRYSIRTCFAYSSINVQLKHKSDKSRVSVLSIKGKSGEEAKAQWENLKACYGRTMAGDFPERLRARTVAMLPTILKNVETFRRAAAVYFGNQRAGDQIGTLLAGAYSLVSSKVIAYSDAVQWIERRDWEDVTENDQKDEVRLLNTLMEYITVFETEDRSRVERTIAELIKVCQYPGLYAVPHSISEDAANERLRRLGFKVDKTNNLLLVQNSSTQIQKILRGTPWINNYSTVLKRIEGAEAKQATTFAHIKSRAVSIPLENIFGED